MPLVHLWENCGVRRTGEYNGNHEVQPRSANDAGAEVCHFPASAWRNIACIERRYETDACRREDSQSGKAEARPQAKRQVAQ